MHFLIHFPHKGKEERKKSDEMEDKDSGLLGFQCRESKPECGLALRSISVAL